MTTAAADVLVGQHLATWGLELLGEAWSTPSSRLARVRRRADGALAVLKVPLVEEERVGSRVLAWWAGDGAATVLAVDGTGVVLVEHADTSAPTLADLARAAEPPGWESDLLATRTLVGVVQRLHRHPQLAVPEGVVPLRQWFRGLFDRADEVGGFFGRAAAVADDLLDDQRGCCVLHGDVHHENVLWFGPGRGWLAIDPKGLLGEPAFDYVNILTNPGRDTMRRPGRVQEHVRLISLATGIERDRLLRWTIAWAGLSAAWHRTAELGGHAADVVEVGLAAEHALGSR